MKTKVSLAFCLAALLAFTAQAVAHDYWAEAKDPKANQKLTAFLGYGHNFPDGEEIKPDSFSGRFQQPKVYSDAGELTLEPGVDNRHYLTVEKAAPGNYVVTTEINAAFSTRTKDGWESKPKNETKDPVKCSNYYRFGKEALVLGSAKYSGLAAKPLGQALEFVPQADPSKIKVGKPFPVKVIFKGQPLRGGEVSAYIAGLVEHNEALFFQSTTNQDGIVNIIPLKAGEWLAKVSVEEPYSDAKVCDVVNYTASYTFKVTN
ncbi:MAG: DUF4198 domain-containing protein [Deltaproteobacteria bacterium]|jgi:uncharacterized GH25 family protein|nr:DUF4198 domain-containing protein [Deltaproteobacteria bacterium]